MDTIFVENNPIKGFDNEISKYLYSLFSSVCSVDSSYLHFAGYNADEDIEHVERVFAYELYHQWCNYPTIKNNKNIVINAEIPKELICEVKNIKESLSYPDMVLHHGQGLYSGNIIVCEIKREKYAEQFPEKVLHDFEKLKVFLSDGVKVNNEKEDWEPFKVGVFILTMGKDSNKKVTVRYIKDIMGKYYEDIKKYSSKIKKRIVCVVYNGKELKFDTLINMDKK